MVYWTFPSFSSSHTLRSKPLKLLGNDGFDFFWYSCPPFLQNQLVPESQPLVFYEAWSSWLRKTAFFELKFCSTEKLHCYVYSNPQIFFSLYFKSLFLNLCFSVSVFEFLFLSLFPSICFLDSVSVFEFLFLCFMFMYSDVVFVFTL